MHRTVRTGLMAGLALTTSTVLALSGMGVPPARATAGNSLTIEVPSTVTTTGATFTIQVVGHSAAEVSGTSATVVFDATKLHVTAIEKGADWTALGASWAGFPSLANTPAFLTSANAAGKVPLIAAYFLDGSSVAGGDHPFLSVTFNVVACGDSAIDLPIGPIDGAMLDGQAATYGDALTVTSASGSVSAPCAVVPPTATVGALAATQLGSSVALAWGSTPGSAAVASYDVRYRKAAWNGAFGGSVTWKSATASTTAPFPVVAGTAYCFSVLARDINGVTSAWTAETCTMAPLDDRSLVPTGTWARKASSLFYKGTYSQSTQLNAKLTRTGATFTRLYLVATTCPTCGSVKVFLGTTLLKSISLKSAATVNRKAILVYTSPTLKSGTVSVKVVTSGKAVKVDGLAIGQ